MTQNIVVRARIDEATKVGATAVLAAAGLSISDIVRRTLQRIAIDKAVPLYLFTPNAETIEAMKAAERGEFEFSGNLEESLAYLNAPD